MDGIDPQRFADTLAVIAQVEALPPEHPDAVALRLAVGRVFKSVKEARRKERQVRILAEDDAVTAATAALHEGVLAHVADRGLDRACRARSGVVAALRTLHFEIDTGDGFREPGFSKERRLDPQITVGLLTDATGFLCCCRVSKGTRPRMPRCSPS